MIEVTRPSASNPLPSLEELVADLSLARDLPVATRVNLYRAVAHLEAELRTDFLADIARASRSVDEPNRALSINEAAAILRTTKDSLYRRGRRLGLGYKDPLDGRLKFSRRALERYISEKQIAPEV